MADNRAQGHYQQGIEKLIPGYDKYNSTAGPMRKNSRRAV